MVSNLHVLKDTGTQACLLPAHTVDCSCAFKACNKPCGELYIRLRYNSIICGPDLRILSALLYNPVDLEATTVSLSWQSNGAHSSFTVLTCHSFTYHLTFLSPSGFIFFYALFHAIILLILHITKSYFSPLAVLFSAGVRSLSR